MAHLRQVLKIKKAKANNKNAKYKVTSTKYTKTVTTKNGTKRYRYTSKKLGKNGKYVYKYS